MGALELPTRPTRHRLTVADYHLLAQAGAIAPDARTELIDGEIIDMAPIGTRHAAVVSRLARLLERTVGDAALLRIQSPIRLGDESEPQPDLALVAPRDDFYESAHPVVRDVLLIVEVSDSSARYDLTVKLPLYARHGVGEVWVVDLEAQLVRSFRRPHGSEYLDATATAQPTQAPVQALPGITIDLGGVLG
jgi:Uma2 family endonuclease